MPAKKSSLKKMEDPPDKPVETLKSELRDREIEMEGQDEVLDEYKKQIEQIAYVLGIANDYPTIKGEIKKLIRVEDDNTLLRGQIRALEGNKKKDIKNGILVLESKLKKKEGLVISLEDKVQRLQSRKQLDRNKTVDLIKETFRRTGNQVVSGFRNFLNIPKRFVKPILKKKIEGVIKRWK